MYDEEYFVKERLIEYFEALLRRNHRSIQIHEDFVFAISQGVSDLLTDGATADLLAEHIKQIPFVEAEFYDDRFEKPQKSARDTELPSAKVIVKELRELAKKRQSLDSR